MNIIKFWFCILIIGMIFFPITSTIFDKFNDKGWIFSKIIGIIISTWTFWILSYLKILKYTRTNIIIIMIFFTITNLLFFFIKKKKPNTNTIKKILLSEILFFSMILFWYYIKGFEPMITNTTEQFMDYGYLNSIMNSEFMPPQDIWLSGKTINYYYYGQYVFGFLCKLCNFNASEGYNLIISIIAGFSFILPYSIGINLFDTKKTKIINITIAILIGLNCSLGGTLQYPIYRWFTGNETNYSYTDEVRYIGYKPETMDKTATEVPAYSNKVGDLHAHYIDLVFSLTTLALLIEYFKNEAKDKKNYIILSLIAVTIGIQKMTNIWDLPIYIVITSLIIITKELICKEFNKKNILKSIMAIMGIIIIEELVSYPFNATLQVNSINVNFTGIISPIYKLIIKWGMPISAIAILIKLFFYKFKTSKQKFKEYLNNNLLDLFIIVIGCCAIGLIILPEIIYLKDIYGDEYKRFNTMFKLTYQAYILFTITTNYTIYRLLTSKIKHAKKTAIILLILTILTIGYGIDMLNTCYKNTKHIGVSEETTEKYLKEKLPDDYKAIKWIRKNLKREKIILEASEYGGSYTLYSRVSTFTGNPTILGWTSHEWIWRANADYSIPQELVDRNDDIKEIYEGKNEKKSKELIKKYNIDYIFIGNIEYESYEKMDIKILKKLGKVVYEENKNIIIEISNN